MHPSLRNLRQAYTDITTHTDVTAERRRQFSAVLDEMTRAAAAGTLPARPEEPLTPEQLEAFLQAAEAGLYRAAVSGTGRTADSTNRTRIDCLNRLSARSGHPLAIPHRTPAPALKVGTTTEEARRLREYLRSQNRQPLLDDDHARILAAIGLCLDTRGRSGELAAVQLPDFAEDHSTLQIRQNPQRRPGTRTILTKPLALSAPTRAALERYLPVRARLIAELQQWFLQHTDQDVDPHHDYLFVSLAPNHTGGRPSVEGGTIMRPAGMPLQPQGLRRALDRAARRINAARPKSRPLPTMEQLRRITEG